MYSETQTLDKLETMLVCLSLGVLDQTESMQPLSTQGGHSAKVKMQLLLNGSCIDVAQMGRRFVMVDAPIEHGPAETVLVLEVDESGKQWKVIFAEGNETGRAASGDRRGRGEWL